MSRRFNNPMTIRALVGGGLLAGALGLGFAENGGGHGSPYGSYGDSPKDEGTGVGEEKGAGGTSAAPQNAALPPNVAPGWKIRICSEKTKAQSISFRVGNADMRSTKEKREEAKEGKVDTDKTQAMETASWSQGDPTVITLPSSVSSLEKIKIEATSGQKDRRSEVCVLYNDHVAKKISFGEKDETTVKMDESAACGC